MSQDAGRKPFFHGVDVLRAAAALMVLVYHVIEHGRWERFPHHGLLHTFRVGWLGVDLFLVISGFVVTYAALGMLARQDSGGFRREFAHRRLRRILPLYLLTLLAYLFLADPALLGTPLKVLAWHVFAHLAFIHNLFRDTGGSIDGPNWSVALEMQFYLLVVLIAPCLRHWRPWLLALGGVTLAIAFRFVILTWFAAGDNAAAWIVHGRTTWLPGSMDEFAVGMALALAVRAGATRWLRPTWPAFIAVTATAVALMTLAMAIYWPRASYWDIPAMIIGWRALLSIGLVAVVAAALCMPASLLSWLRPVRYLGQISYGIYLWHLPVLLTMIRAGFHDVGLLATTLLGTLSLSVFSWHGFEQAWMQGTGAPSRSRLGEPMADTHAAP